MKNPIYLVKWCKSDFLFALLLVTFELFEVEQSYIPLVKALMCGIDAVEAQGCGCMFTFCHVYLKMGVLLHKMAIVCNQKFMAVCMLRLFFPQKFNLSFYCCFEMILNWNSKSKTNKHT